MNAALERLLSTYARALAPILRTRDDARHAAVAILGRSIRPWRIAFAMHSPIVGTSRVYGHGAPADASMASARMSPPIWFAMWSSIGGRS